MKRFRTMLAATGAALLLTLGLGAVPAQAARPAATLTLTNDDGRKEDFRVVNSLVEHRWQNTPGGSWSNWHLIKASGNPQVYSLLSGEKNANGRLEIFVHRRNVDDVMHIWQNDPGSGWSNWHSLGGIISSTERGVWTRLIGSQIEIIVRGTDGNYHSRYQQQPNCCWSGWELSHT